MHRLKTHLTVAGMRTIEMLTTGTLTIGQLTAGTLITGMRTGAGRAVDGPRPPAGGGGRTAAVGRALAAPSEGLGATGAEMDAGGRGDSASERGGDDETGTAAVPLREMTAVVEEGGGRRDLEGTRNRYW